MLLPIIRGSPKGRPVGHLGYFPLYQLKGWYPGVTQAPIKTGESASDQVASEDDATGSLFVGDKETLAKETVTVASEVCKKKNLESLLK